MANLVLHQPKTALLPENRAYTNRFNIRSQSSNRLYVVAQSKSGGWWSCSCPGWIRYKDCKHLKTLGLPGHYRKFNAILTLSSGRN